MPQETILVVEDDRVTSEYIRYALEQRGFRVTVALDGLSASRAVAAQRPDLILLDLMLPDLDGWELCTMIRTLPDPEISSTPIIILTARATTEDRLRGLRLGADDYITKPFSMEEVVLKIRNLVSRRLRCAVPFGVRDVEDHEGVSRTMQGMLYHELKNHLVAISGFARRIEGMGRNLAEEKLKNYAAVIRRSADHLSWFVDDFLLFQKIESQEFETHQELVDLECVAEDVLSFLKPQAEEKGVQIEFRRAGARLPPVRFNEAAGKICVSNLVENAIKYSPAGGRIVVCLEGGRSGGVLLTVEDEGPGIPAEEKSRIFEKFYRGRLTEKSTKGTGLGLYIVKSLVESLGGCVSVDDRPSAGALFRIEFCADQPGEIA